MSDWVVEAALQFVRQPLWTTPVQNFIDSNCVSFDNEEELKLEYTSIHKKFQELIEGILESMLQELGVGPEVLVEACEAQKETDPNIKKFLQYLYSLDDFRSFRAIMVKRNVELEHEAMEAWSRMQEYHAAKQLSGSNADAGLSDSEKKEVLPQSMEDDEDAKQLQLALQASLQNEEKIMKAAEVEDADLQAALALSMAEEAERIRREEDAARAKADEAKKEADAKATKEATDSAAEAEKKKQAEEEHKKAEEEIQRKKKEAEQAMKVREEEVLTERTEKLAQAVVAAENAAEKQAEEKKAKSPDAPPAPAVTHVSLTQSDKPEAAGLGDIQNHRRVGGFGKFGALPTLNPSFGTLLKQEVAPQVAKPSTTLSDEAQAKKDSAEEKAAAEARAKQEMEARAKYMAEQRRLLIEKKKQQRDGDLQNYMQENQLSSQAQQSAPPAATAGGISKDEKEHNDMSRALMRRFKDDLIQESSKPLK